MEQHSNGGLSEYRLVGARRVATRAGCHRPQYRERQTPRATAVNGVTLGVRPPELTPVGFIGNGVDVTSIERLFDGLLNENIRTSTSAQGRLGILSAYSSRINNLLADPEIGLSPQLATFFGALEDAANDPSSTELRQILIGEAKRAGGPFSRQSTAGIRALDKEINQAIELTVNDVNGLAAEIADLNDRIVLARNASGSEPNDLLDQRDHLITELSKKIAITTVETSEGHVNVLANPGNSLVNRPQRQPARRRPQSAGAGAGRREAAGSIDRRTGGRPARGRSARSPDRGRAPSTSIRRCRNWVALRPALAQSFNARSNAGFDLGGSLGVDFWRLGAPSVQGSLANTGSGSLAVDVADIGQVTGDDYEIQYNGSSYDVVRASDRSIVTSSGTGTGGDPLLFEGISVVVSGTPAAGDAYLVRPTRDAAGSIGVAIVDPAQVALALPLRATSDAANAGTGGHTGNGYRRCRRSESAEFGRHRIHVGNDVLDRRCRFVHTTRAVTRS